MRARKCQQRRQHVEAMPIGELAGRDHDGVLAPVTTEPETLSQALHHGQVGSTPGVICRCPVPAHAGQLAAVRAAKKATRDGGDRRWPALHLGMDEKEVIRRLGQPDKIVGGEDRMRSLDWVCSTWRSATATVVPMPRPAPSSWCGGIAFEIVDGPPQ